MGLLEDRKLGSAGARDGKIGVGNDLRQGQVGEGGENPLVNPGERGAHAAGRSEVAVAVFEHALDEGERPLPPTRSRR